MSDTLTLKAQVRQEAGSKAAARLRQQGLLPAIIYGHKKNPIAVTLTTHDFVEALHHGHRIFDVDVEGSKETLLVRDLQYDHLGKSVIHADLIRVDLSERVTVEVPVNFLGTAKGTQEGGIVEEVLNQVEIECKVSEIPDSLPVNIKEMELGGAIHVDAIELQPDWKLITDPEAVLVVCHEPKAVPVEEEAAEGEAILGVEGAEAAPAEPEVITEKKEEGEASE